MEANTKQQQLTFDKGMTNVPSDLLCSDNTLSLADGMIFRNGEHHVIQKPVTFLNESDPADGIPNILYIHRFNNEERYIGRLYGRIEWGTKDGTTFRRASPYLISASGNIEISSIGKTLIIADENGLHYYIWSYDKSNNNAPIYTRIGDALPTPKVEFMLVKLNETENLVTSEQARGSNWLESSSGVYTNVNPLHQEDWNNLIVGMHSKNKYDIHQKKRFWGTFAIRVALKMYDGSYAMVSDPIIMFNQFQIPCIAWINNLTVKMGLRGQELKYKKTEDLSAWKDLISEITIFVSRESALFDTASNATCVYYTDGGRPSGYAYGTCISGGTNTGKSTKHGVISAVGSNDIYEVLNNIEDEKIKELAENGLFYKLCSIGLDISSDWESVDGHITTGTLENITTQEQLIEGDYFGHSEYIPSFIYTYNSRLNMANVSRSVFKGFSYFLPYDNQQDNTYIAYVKIATDSGERVVKKEYQTSQKQGIWFYYPDSRASHVTIYKGDDCILDKELKEHPELHGAYYFMGNLSAGNNDDEPSAITPTPSTALDDDDVDESPEILPNYVIQSEVNNPFIFRAAGYFKVGTGKIVGMSTITQALSEGQFGQYPLLVFSESGIWSLSVASTGYYDSVRPMSREVALLDNPCITQTDGAVFFASRKGLMVVVGGQVKCVSEQLAGKVGNTRLGNFATFLSTAIIAYDYRDSLLWIFDKTNTACWVYSIKSGTFGQFDFGAGKAVTSVVNAYPDFLMQNTDGVFSLLERPDINNDPSSYSAQLISRPLKLENALALKTIIQAVHVKALHSGASMTWRVEASNNAITWVQLPSLTGIPWKYYRFTYTFSNLSATDSFAGTVLITQERRTDKLR